MFNPFKKQKKIEPEVVYETKEVKVYSRLKFAHNPSEIHVLKFFFIPKVETKLSDVLVNKVFMYRGIAADDTPTIEYPIFKMPNKLPASKLVSNKKINCIGAIIVDDCTHEIKGLSSKFSGMSLEDINEITWGATFDENTLVTLMSYDNTIQLEVVDGDVDIETYDRSITLNNVLELVMNDPEE